MTLSTNFVIAAPAGMVEHYAEEFYQVCRKMIGTPEDYVPKREASDPFWGGEGVHGISHRPGLGLPAWLLLYYRPDGPKLIDPDPEEFDPEEIEYELKNPFKNGFGSILLDLDTSYGFEGPNGETCSELHAAYITFLGDWCDQRELAWQWKNEYTGEWHVHRDGLTEFAQFHGAEVSEWFSGVQALIQAAAGVK